MKTKFIYKCKIAGSTTDIYLTDLEAVKEYYDAGNIITCKREKGVF